MSLLGAFFLIIALVYSSVGFGGGSSYTALLAWRGESPEVIRMVSLTCNLVVVCIGGWASLKAGQMRLRLLGPLLVTSVPGVWLGALWKLETRSFFLILGVALLVSGLLLIIRVKSGRERTIHAGVLGLLGFMLGGLAGVTGIGGGIYLVPILHLLGAGKAREVAAVGTVFILVNSAIGLTVLTFREGWDSLGKFSWLPLVVMLGGIMGSRLLQGVFPQGLVKRMTGILVLIVAGRLLFL